MRYPVHYLAACYAKLEIVPNQTLARRVGDARRIRRVKRNATSVDP